MAIRDPPTPAKEPRRGWREIATTLSDRIASWTEDLPEPAARLWVAAAAVFLALAAAMAVAILVG